MYIDSLVLQDYRNFYKEEVAFLYSGKLDNNSLPNVNLLLGANGSGKTTLLRAMAIGLMPELMPHFNPRYLIRHEGKEAAVDEASIQIKLCLSGLEGNARCSSRKARIRQDRGISAEIDIHGGTEDILEEIYKEHASSYFMVGYGATR